MEESIGAIAGPADLARFPMGPTRTDPSNAVRLRVLGPLSMSVDERFVVPNAGKQRQLLALLAVHRNKVVGVDSIVRELWNDEPPRSASTALQTYIGQIRQLFAESLDVDRKEVAARHLVTEADGYSLRLAPSNLDLHHFEAHSTRARAAIAAGDLETARRALRASLQCWRGNPLDNVRKGPILDRWAQCMTDLRLWSVERWIEVNMATGLHQDMYAEIMPLCGEHPLHEGFQALLMMILYRCGRSVAALDTFVRFRTRIMDELGAEPSPRLARLYHSILVGKPVTEPFSTLAARTG